MLLTVLFRAGNIEEVLESPTGQPYIAILPNATGSPAGTAVMVGYIILSLVFCAIKMVTTSSRQIYSLAREGGVPFSRTLPKVSSKRSIPTNSIMLTLAFTVVISLIIIGSTPQHSVSSPRLAPALSCLPMLSRYLALLTGKFREVSCRTKALRLASSDFLSTSSHYAFWS